MLCIVKNFVLQNKYAKIDSVIQIMKLIIFFILHALVSMLFMNEWLHKLNC